MKRINIAVMILAALGFAGFTVSTASGDIYSWTDENGVRYFTNYAPPKQARLLMKTPEIPHDEAADLQRRELDRLEAAKQELAEKQAALLQQQQEAERRIEAARARAEEALQEADRILQGAQAAAENTDTGRSNAYGYVYPYYGYGPRYLYKGYERYDGSLYRKGHYSKKFKRPYGQQHPKRSYYKPYRRHHVRSHDSITRGRYTSHQSRVATFRARHGRY